MLPSHINSSTPQEEKNNSKLSSELLIHPSPKDPLKLLCMPTNSKISQSFKDLEISSESTELLLERTIRLETDNSLLTSTTLLPGLFTPPINKLQTVLLLLRDHMLSLERNPPTRNKMVPFSMPSRNSLTVTSPRTPFQEEADHAPLLKLVESKTMTLMSTPRLLDASNLMSTPMSSLSETATVETNGTLLHLSLSSHTSEPDQLFTLDQLPSTKPLQEEF